MRDGPLDKWWAGRVIQKIHAREGHWKKIMLTRSDEKADNCIATENFWAATLYSSVLSPIGIPFTWLSLQLGKWTPIYFQADIFCVQQPQLPTWIKTPASWKVPHPITTSKWNFCLVVLLAFSLYPFWNLQNPLWSTHISSELIELQTRQNFWHTAWKVKISTQHEEEVLSFILHKKRSAYITGLACRWALLWGKPLFAGYSRIYIYIYSKSKAKKH